MTGMPSALTCQKKLTFRRLLRLLKFVFIPTFVCLSFLCEKFSSQIHKCLL